jgi:pyruvate/2-oxoacid:ferredoxin oxidoreductase beta subunit
VGKSTSGKNNRGKNLALIMAMHKIPYAATATMSNLEDLAKKLLKAKEMKNEGFCCLHVFCPCPTGWGVATDTSIELCKMAVKTNYFPLWEAYKGNFSLTHEVKSPKPVADYIKLIRKFAHFSDKDLDVLQKDVDYNYALLSHITGLDKECAL